MDSVEDWTGVGGVECEDLIFMISNFIVQKDKKFMMIIIIIHTIDDRAGENYIIMGKLEWTVLKIVLVEFSMISSLSVHGKMNSSYTNNK